MLFFSWVWLFGITGSAVKEVLLIALGILAFSTIASIIIVHFIENHFTSYYYIISSIWLGLGWYVLLATIASLVLASVFPEINTAITASVLLGLAALYTVYGIINAQKIRVKKIEIIIPNLPPSWENKKAVQISDVHLGVFCHQGFMKKIVRLINEQSPALVFITGDLFDGAGKKLNHLADPIKNILAPEGIYYITGNHETYVSLENSLAAVRLTPARILNDEITELNGMQLLGISYPKPGEKKDFGNIFKKINPAKPSIVLYHEPKVAVVELAKAAGASLMLSGHTHVGQLWPFAAITRALYKKRDWGLSREGAFNIYTSSGAGTWGPPMRTGNYPEIVSITFKSR